MKRGGHLEGGYGQRGAFHIIERQMAAAVELFPIFARASYGTYGSNLPALMRAIVEFFTKSTTATNPPPVLT